MMNDRNQTQTIGCADAPSHGGLTKPAPVSAVVPCFRCAATIDDAVASIAAQTLPPAEVLLVDDASGDDTLEALHRVAENYPAGWIKVIALPTNGGVSRARNTGWEHARQPYIALLDADDTWAEPHKLELQMAVLESDTAIALIAHKALVGRRGTALPALQPPVHVEIVGRRTLLLRNPFPTSSVVLRRDLPFRFDEEFRNSQDYLLWSQIVFSGYRCAKIDQVLALWTERGNGDAAGLSDDFAAVQRARSRLRRKLLREGLLSRVEYVFASTVGLMTRTRRSLVLRLRKRRPYRTRAPASPLRRP
jgi:glycosyltransferase involved in cell wall biosynthesis